MAQRMKAHRILILEDVAADAELAERQLRRAGLPVTCRHAADRRGFEQALEEFRPDVILSDYGLPGFSGLAALDLAQSRRPGTPFIFVSGSIGEETAVEFLRRGATDYILKTSLTRLAPAVARALEEAAEREAKRRAEDAERRLAAIIEATSDLVATADPQGRLLYMNRAGRDMLGLDAEQDISLLTILDTVPEWRRPFVAQEAIPAILRDGIWSGETVLMERRGQEIPVSVVGLAHRSAEGGIAFLSTIARDITQQKAQEARIMRLNRVYAVLSGINSAIVRIRERRELLEEACRIAVEQGSFQLAWIGLLDAETGEVQPVARAGADQDYLEEIVLSARQGIPGACPFIVQALREKIPAIANDLETDPRGETIRASMLSRGFRSGAVLPLLVAGEAIGVLALYSEEGKFFDDEEMKLLTELSGDIGFALEVLEKDEKLNYLAYYDVLTALPNRELFYDRVSRLIGSATESGQGVAVLALNLERFRTINETFGMGAGDAVLRQFAVRLTQAVGKPGTVARIGADGFALALPGIRDAADVAHLLDRRVMAALDEPFTVASQELRVPAKAGVALYPNDGDGAPTLFLNAEAALNKAKQSGERYLFYAPEMNARVAEKLALENRLRIALLERQFVLHYQPKVALQSGRVCGLEALIRWNAPGLGLVPPGQFIPLLEETGMILEAGRWVLVQAMADYRTWHAKGLRPPRVAVNVSALQLRRQDFVATVEQALAGDEALAAGLELEITESLIMQNIEKHISKLQGIRELGVNVAIDDFGTGYSSLSYLAKLPVTTLKIDRGFIIDMPRNRDSLNIVSTIISLAHSLGLRVVAEGVDAMDQLELLRQLGCDEIQGYLFSRSVPAEQVERIIDGSVGGWSSAPPDQRPGA